MISIDKITLPDNVWHRLNIEASQNRMRLPAYVAHVLCERDPEFPEDEEDDL